METTIDSIELLNDYIIIKDIPNQEVNVKGIIIPQQKYDRYAVVIKSLDDSFLKEGDIIVKPIQRGTPIRIGSEYCELLNQNLVFAKITE